MRHDRFVGAMGGEGPIYYQAISRYARDQSIGAAQFDEFRRIVLSMDAEYLDYVSEKAKAQEAKRKNETK